LVERVIVVFVGVVGVVVVQEGQVVLVWLEVHLEKMPDSHH